MKVKFITEGTLKNFYAEGRAKDILNFIIENNKEKEAENYILECLEKQTDINNFLDINSSDILRQCNIVNNGPFYGKDIDQAVILANDMLTKIIYAVSDFIETTVNQELYIEEIVKFLEGDFDLIDYHTKMKYLKNAEKWINTPTKKIADIVKNTLIKVEQFIDLGKDGIN